MASQFGHNLVDSRRRTYPISVDVSCLTSCCDADTPEADQQRQDVIELKEMVNKKSMRQLFGIADHVEGIGDECEGVNAKSYKAGQLAWLGSCHKLETCPQSIPPGKRVYRW